MTRGYVIQANNELELYQAELLCNSIKIKNKDASVSLITHLKVETELFDHVVEYPFYYNMNTRQNDWQLYWASPYEYTIAIDCKSLVFESHDNLWDYLIENHSVCLPTSVLDFRDNVLEYKQLKKYQEEYKLNIVCSNLFYFDKSEESVQYFKMLDPICHHWRNAEQSLFQKQHTNKKYYPDLIHTIVANSIPFDVFPYFENLLSYIDMRVTWQDGVLPIGESWTDILSVWSTDLAKIKLQNYSINKTIYYHEDTFYNEQIANDFRNYRETIYK